MFPHGYCIRWNFELLAAHVSSDLVVALTYYAIPFILMGVRRQIESVIGRRVLESFAAFIVACGTTHVMDVIVIWYPVYVIQAAVKTITALVSIAASVHLLRLVRAARRVG